MTPNDYVFIICGNVWDDGEISKHIRKLKKYDNVFFE